MSDMKEKIKKRESPAGFHFYHVYADCPRKWYLKYVCGFQHEFTGKALIFGGVIHEAIETFYKALLADEKNPAGICLETFKRELGERREEYEKEEDYNTDADRGPIMLDAWMALYGLSDLDRYEILGIENERELLIGGGETKFRFTVRPDIVVRDKATNLIHVMDHKTTGWSLDGAIKSAIQQDQLTGYVWAERKAGVAVEGAIVDAIYMRGSRVEPKRSDPIYFSKYSIVQFELGMFGLISEVSQKYALLRTTPAEILFPRFGESCSKFGCVYEGICRERQEPGVVPYGFELDPWYIEDDMKTAQRAFGKDKE